MALIKLPELEPRQYTYIGFSMALLGMLSIVITIASILELFGIEKILPWPILAAISLLLLLVATLAFHKMGAKKVAL